MTKDEAGALVEQVRTAHLLSVAFYQRLLPLLTGMGSDLAVDFWYWKPTHNARPCRGTTPPDKNWLWDMLPMFAFHMVYRRVQGGNAVAGDKAIVFYVCLEESFKQDLRKQNGSTEEPNPLTLPNTRSLIEVGVFRCLRDDTRPFDDIWSVAGTPGNVDGWQRVHDNLEAVLMTFEMADFLSDPLSATEEIRRKMDQVQ